MQWAMGKLAMGNWHTIYTGIRVSLSKYKEKRSFDKTPEPTGGKPTDNTLHFVVQKHHASHLHYDFRLEMEGVLKSWAVPKGPSMNPADKRLAMMVEDHPWDYRNFEGIIPEGYGAGTVIVWDNGSYEPIDKKKTKKDNEKSLLHHLYKGALSFKLKGKKLKGEFSLVKTPDRGDNAWLLIKKKDKYAIDIDITKKDKSVKSNKTLDEVKKTSTSLWHSHREKKETVKKRGQAYQQTGTLINEYLKKGKKTKMPRDISPMLSTLIKSPFTDENYLFEVKWDGYRVLAYKQKDNVILRSRSGLNYTKYYKIVEEELKKLEYDLVCDGEIVVLNKSGKPDFDALQKYKGADPIAYYVFDVLWCNGYSLTDIPLIERKELLLQLLPGGEIIKYSDHFDDGLELFELIKQQELEGVVAKKRESKYLPGTRGRDWLKIPTEKRQEFVIGGWTESESGSAFRSLLFGYYENGNLIFQGHAGHGFKEIEKPQIKATLKKMEIKKSPFINDVDVATEVHWVKPKLVADIKFATKTRSGKIRKPAIFLGFRQDKEPDEVIHEMPVDVNLVLNKNANGNVTEESNWREIKKEKITSKEVFNIAGNELELTNVEKLFWKDITKAELVSYYHTIAPYILPHLKDRPLSLHIKNNGATKPGFYIKDMEGNAPSFADIYTTKRKHLKKGRRDIIEYLVCNNVATLLYVINLGCIDINPWTSTTASPLQPDYIIIDLDPSDSDFQKAIQTAKAAKKIFDKLKITTFCKTSGKTGIHIYIPCKGFTFPEARTIAQKICGDIHKAVPEITTTEITVDKRGDKLYLDPNQNDEADTVAAPYSVRPHHHPTVSTPLDWKEVTIKLNPSDFTLHTLPARIKQKGELFKNVLDKKIAGKNSAKLKKFI
jgi:bifunctional non-homologous end joining protein LigD